jgi:hypothetical protein
LAEWDVTGRPAPLTFETGGGAMCTKFWSVAFLLAGSVLLLDNLGYLHLSLGQLWPLWLIGLGLLLLASRGRRRRQLPTGGERHAS